MDALSNLARARAKLVGDARYEYVPPQRDVLRPGGDLDDSTTLRRVLPSAAADGEVMLLCMGNDGTIRMGVNLILSFAAMGLRHMLVFADQVGACEALWQVVPSVACVWWPSQWARQRPPSLYNERFSRTALVFFEARKRLLERLVFDHGLNVLHLDGDTVWFANPYPLLKRVYADRQIIAQTDNPFVNAGVFYVQNVRRGDGAAWVLQELNRRVERFTYRPESVASLPDTTWARPPYFANADEQASTDDAAHPDLEPHPEPEQPGRARGANLNDVVASALSRAWPPTYAGGVEFAEARFKERFAPRRCFGARRKLAGCDGVHEARARMADHRWQRRLNEGGSVAMARRMLRRRQAESRYEPLVHICDRSWDAGREGSLHVPLPPANRTARHRHPDGSLLLAPSWLFSHFPYGSFFDSFRSCHAASWGWSALTPTERRLCFPHHRVPAIMVHMAGLRQEAWGRRAMMRALGVWQDGADAVAPHAWVSARDVEARAESSGPDSRRQAWSRVGRLLVTRGLVAPEHFESMSEYDRFAARLLLVGLLLRRRVVFPPIPCSKPYMQKALQARHLRGMEVGCGDVSQCVWLPYPHHIEPWCAGVDFLYDVDYRALVANKQLPPAAEVATIPLEGLRQAFNHSGERLELSSPAAATSVHHSASIVELYSDVETAHTTIVWPHLIPSLQRRAKREHLTTGRGGRAAGRSAREHDSSAHDRLGWIPLGGFRTETWRAPFPRRVEAFLRAPSPAGLALSDGQVHIVKTCLKSLATSKE